MGKRRCAAALVAGLAVAAIPAGGPAYGIANGAPVAQGTDGFVAHLRIGEVRACSGALVHPRSGFLDPPSATPEQRWVLTAASCFAKDGQPTRFGPPPWPTTVTIGRANLLATDVGTAIQATDVIPHPDRDVALVRLASPVSGVTPAKLPADPLPVGGEVRVAGYGRTATEWVSDRLDSGAFTVQAVGEASYDITSSASACDGDAGAPMFRAGAGTSAELHGLVIASGQAGCLTETETRNGATAVRVQDLREWVSANTAAQPSGLVRLEKGELTGDQYTDLLGVDAAGDLWIHPGLSTPARFGRPVRVGSGWTSMPHMTVGEFTGDGYDDVVGGDPQGRLWVYPGRGLAGFGTRIQIGLSGWTAMEGLDVGRFNEDAYDDILAVGTGGELWVYPGRSDGQLNPRVKIGNSGWAAMVHVTAGEFNEDAYEDVLAIDAAGKLWLYPGRGSAGLASRIEIGSSGWAPMRTFTVGEFNRDAYNDVLVFDRDGKLRLYPGTNQPGVGSWVEIGARVVPAPGAPVTHDVLGTPVPEEYAYPHAGRILAEQNVKLIAGDGHILLADCATPPQGDIGLLKVFTTEEEIGADGIGRVCFRVRAPYGFLDLEVPGVYEIRGDGLRTGTGHEVTANLRDDDGQQLTVDVDPDGSTQVGLGADPDASPTMLLRLTVTG
ncbi:trypsin-like serine protease [Actinomycetes bacterium KLBMP 9797]